tara:strand:+ start:2556 stop:3503 length:948 start_codon:yes stop_codon:yes gene_type:complete
VRKLIFIFCIFCVFFLKAQDVHFSQFSIGNIGLNPAIVGTQDTDYKVTLQKRRQWASVANPFSSFAICFETKNIYLNTPVGIQFINDIAGDANFTTSQLNFAINKSLAINQYKQFSMGIFLGYAQREIDYSDLVFAETEQLQNSSFIFFDVGLGGNYSVTINDNFSVIMGLGAYHINSPKQSLLKDDDIRLNQKYNYYLRSFFQLNHSLIISPSLLYSEQGKSNEFIFGSTIKHELSTYNTKLIGEVFYRWKDAIIPSLGLNYQHITAIISYDINTSDLVTASKHKGGFEFSVIYMWNRKQKQEIKIKKYCPKYL